MFKKFFIKQMLKRQMKDMPKDQQEKVIKLVSENPEIFSKIGTEIKQKMAEGKDQMAATMEVMRNHQDELKGIM